MINIITAVCFVFFALLAVTKHNKAAKVTIIGFSVFVTLYMAVYCFVEGWTCANILTFVLSSVQMCITVIFCMQTAKTEKA